MSLGADRPVWAAKLTPSRDEIASTLLELHDFDEVARVISPAVMHDQPLLPEDRVAADALAASADPQKQVIAFLIRTGRIRSGRRVSTREWTAAAVNPIELFGREWIEYLAPSEATEPTWTGTDAVTLGEELIAAAYWAVTRSEPPLPGDRVLVTLAESEPHREVRLAVFRTPASLGTVSIHVGLVPPGAPVDDPSSWIHEVPWWEIMVETYSNPEVTTVVTVTRVSRRDPVD
jgi:hypothetical protein